MKPNLTYTVVAWEMLPLCCASGWEVELWNDQKQECLIYKVGQQELFDNGIPVEIGSPEPKPHPPAQQPPMRKQ